MTGVALSAVVKLSLPRGFAAVVVVVVAVGAVAVGAVAEDNVAMESIGVDDVAVGLGAVKNTVGVVPVISSACYVHIQDAAELWSWGLL